MISISILLMLLSLLVPKIRKIQSHAHKINCSKNLKNIGAAYYLYAEDCDQFVADCFFIGAISAKTIWYNETEGNYRAVKFGGFFHNGRAGYLDPYLEGMEDTYSCPGIESSQGLMDFTADLHTTKSSTYTSFTPFPFQLRKTFNRYILNEKEDYDYGFDKYTIKPIFLDPIMSMSAWYGGKSNPVWDQSQIKIHESSPGIPVLMSDGHTSIFDRSLAPVETKDDFGYLFSFRRQIIQLVLESY